jgi:GNAT superfamily N-acetyltransferase
MAAPNALLERIQGALVADLERMRDRVDVGPFAAFLDHQTSFVWMNYAVQVAGDATSEDVETLAEAFEAHGRTPRFEYFEELWPELGGLLDAAGFSTERRIPAMACTADSFRPHDDLRIAVSSVGVEDDLDSFARTGDAAFGVPDSELDEARVASTRDGIARGTLQCAIAKVDGEIAGIGCLVGSGEVRELAGIGTLPRFRRQGVASAVSSALIGPHLETGGLVWLSAGDDAAEAVYSRLGFFRVGTQRNASRQSAT